MDLCEFETSQAYSVSSRTARAATQKDPVLGKKENKEGREGGKEGRKEGRKKRRERKREEKRKFPIVITRDWNNELENISPFTWTIMQDRL